MTNYEMWKAVSESFQGVNTLGLSRPQTIGGLVGSRLRYDEEFDDNDEFDDEDEEFDDEDGDEDEDDEGKEGDLVGSTGSDEGPNKNWPPDDSSPEDDFGDEELGDDFLSSLGAGAGGKSVNHGPSSGNGDIDDNDLAFLSGIDGEHPDALGGSGMDDLGGEEGLDDLGSGMDDLGGEEGLDDLGSGMDDLGGEEGMGGNAHGLMGEPCPDCNPEGAEEVGDEKCPTCGGMGFLDSEEGDVQNSDPDLNALSDQMASYMKKYMRKYMKGENFDMNGQQMPMQQLTVPAAPQMPMQAQPMQKKMVSFMSKKGMKKFMAADAPRKYMRKDDKKNCKCEGADFYNALINQACGNIHKKLKNVREDALLAPEVEQPRAGDVGFAPQGRIGSIGGGYTKDDFSDIPVLGESTRYPTLNEYAAWKARNQKSKNRKRN